MPTNYKVLGQAAPAATTNTTLYTVPSATQSVVSTITVCNRSTAQRTFRIAVRPAGETLANQHYVSFDSTIAASDTAAITIGVTLAASDVITVFASSADLTFQAFGSEVS
jgi:hypothetical protein